jgi:hypothetical protein
MYFPAEIRANYDNLYMQRYNLTKSVDDKFKERLDIMNHPERRKKKMIIKEEGKKTIEE